MKRKKTNKGVKESYFEPVMTRNSSNTTVTPEEESLVEDSRRVHSQIIVAFGILADMSHHLTSLESVNQLSYKLVHLQQALQSH